MNRTIEDDAQRIKLTESQKKCIALPKSTIYRTIQDDARHALTMLNLDISDVLLSRGTRSIMDKKKLLYCYLRIECGYSWHEIGTYCNKDHTTILKVVNKYTQDNNTNNQLGKLAMAGVIERMS